MAERVRRGQHVRQQREPLVDPAAPRRPSRVLPCAHVSTGDLAEDLPALRCLRVRHVRPLASRPSAQPGAQDRRDPVHALASDTRILVTGTIGTGKTTELLRVVEARDGQELVVFLDLARHFDRLGRIEGLQHVNQWEVCFLVGLALYRTAEEKLGFPFP